MVKFVLTGFPRTGTTVVSGSIIQHPEILFYGELFNSVAEVRSMEAQRKTLGAGWQFDEPLGWGLPACSYDASARAYMQQVFTHSDSHKATGFKLMYDQILSGPNSDGWDYLRDNTDIRIIRTKRDNVLEAICSYVRARVTRRWHVTGGDTPQHRFVVPLEEFDALLKRFTVLPDAIKAAESTHQILDLDYARISTDFAGCMADVYAFLDVSPQKINEPRLKKIATQKPDQELANYQELKQHYRDSEFSRHFSW